MDIRTPVETNYGGLVTQYADAWKEQIAKMQAKFGAAIEEVRMPVEHPTDMPIIYVKKESVVDVIAFAKTELGYDFLVDLTATDEQPNQMRFEIVYILKSMSTISRIRFKVRLAEGEEVPTLSNVWPGADWQEREVWDMFGVKFSGHPDLRRILMDQRWVGHPLRKDYPLRGYQIFPTPEPVDEKLLNN